MLGSVTPPCVEQVAQRFTNSHAIVNAASSFRRRGADGALSYVRMVVGRFDTPEVGANLRFSIGGASLQALTLRLSAAGVY